MSLESNIGAENALTKGVSTSVSVMMPCSWVPGFVHFLHAHPADVAGDDKKPDDYKTAKYIDALKTIKPGVTTTIMHCSDAGPAFKNITDSGPTRRGDMLEQGTILTTWREWKQRRDKVK
jgi:hypothetical protein